MDNIQLLVSMLMESSLEEAAAKPPTVQDAWQAGFYFDGTIYEWLADWYHEPLLHAMTYGPKMHQDLFDAFESGRQAAARKYGHVRKPKVVSSKPRVPTYHTPATM